ncbi:ubiquinol-cytochrome c reductase iron-sulfur subunit [Uliginosibacterium aquaticum]|uniref:Ubiquinol-cytochrome c reductase iron-sulfur subunit n=1 Tax=Uliginosibacterium aquaticum TaxID=2731212 RepID=A0ABX2IQX8_9RHOO|nr:ubiquinol-cytochrome c reductase iron-sulfur subunit [Uliginosibacterium aquaticum]NSL56395.1 ubiquinol-cytochrome c reductase iron-sulfur subunit [Uliginosibacterium aquaticum]
MSDHKLDASAGGASFCACSLDSSRRTLLAATAGVGAVAAAGVAVPFVASFTPSERAKAAGAPVEVDLSKLQPGEKMTVEWQGKPVWVLRRTPEMLAVLKEGADKLVDPESQAAQQPAYVKGIERAINPEYFVCIGICTHLGCSPSDKLKAGAESGMGAEWKGGFLCPCHGSQFDLAGRVFKAMPAPTNLVIPPHTYLSETRLLIGEDSKGA